MKDLSKLQVKTYGKQIDMLRCSVPAQVEKLLNLMMDGDHKQIGKLNDASKQTEQLWER